MSIYAAPPTHRDYISDATKDSSYGYHTVDSSYYAQGRYQPTDLYYDYGSTAASEFQQKPPASFYLESDNPYPPPATYAHHYEGSDAGWQPTSDLHAPSPKHPSPLIEQDSAAYLQWREYPTGLPASAEPDIAAYSAPPVPSYPVWDVPASTIPPVHHIEIPLPKAPSPQKRRRDSKASLLDKDKAAVAATASLLERNKVLAAERKALVDARIIVPRVPRNSTVPFVSQTRLVSSKPAFATSASGAEWHIQAAIAAAQPEAPEPDSTLPKGTGRIGKAPHVACHFCRTRKIACGRPTEGDGPCNQCSKRGLAHKCEYPPTSKRGQHKRPLKSALEGMELVSGPY